MKMLIMSIVFLGSITANAAGEQCSKMCNPEISKPCGNACISKSNNCHKPWTTACVGIRSSGGKSYEKPQHVSSAPKS